MTDPLSSHPLEIADAMRGIRHVFVRDLEVETEIGIHPHERHVAQRIIVNVDLAVSETPVKDTDRYSDVVCYDHVVARVRRFAEEGHVNLVETMAERIAAACLEDSRVLSARVRIEKPDIFEDCRSVGIEIERFQPIP